MRSLYCIGLLLFLGAPNAWAVNKCTGPDGKVSYQESPCPTAARTQEMAAAPLSAAEASKLWQYTRAVDSMTNTKTCAVISPTTYLVGRNYRDVTDARVVVTALANERFLASVHIGKGNLIHNDVRGMGLKAEPGQFYPLDIKAGQKLVSTSQSGAVIDELLAARSVRLRLRFWPYDDLLDTDPIEMAGFRQAMVQAANCAKAN